jgi:hypothetical protein
MTFKALTFAVFLATHISLPQIAFADGQKKVPPPEERLRRRVEAFVADTHMKGERLEKFLEGRRKIGREILIRARGSRPGQL